MIHRLLFEGQINIQRRTYVWNMLSSMFYSVQSALFLLVATRVAGEAEAGSFIILFTVAQTLNTVGNYNIRDFQVSDVREEYGFPVYLTTRLITCAVMLALAMAYCFWKHLSSGAATVMICLAAYRMLECLEDVFHGAIQRAGRFDVASICMTSRIILSSTGFCVVYILSGSQIPASVALLAVCAVTGTYLLHVVRAEFRSVTPIRLSLEGIPRLLVACFPIFIGAFLYTYLINVPKYAIADLMNAEVQTVFNILFMPAFVINIRYIPDDVMDRFIAAVRSQSVLFGDVVDREVSIVYTPLNGTGLKPVTRVLEESGFTNITVVEEQRNPDGNFPTCPYPNPEIREAMALGLRYCVRVGADLLLATDPDADRCGIAVRDGDHYRLLTGNEVGLLLLDYICSQRIAHGRMPKSPVFIKTIVTMDLAEKIAAHYGARTVNVLTGFKFIGEQIGKLEKQGRAEDYICGFEESYGYLTGAYVRDKDAVGAAFMICEMFAFYKTRGVSLIQKLDALYAQYGYCLNTLHTYEFSGSAGMEKMRAIMGRFHEGLDEIAGIRVARTEDYTVGLNGLPKSDVLKFCTDSGSVVIRPSGTEPKLKAYISVTADDAQQASNVETRIAQFLQDRIR